MAIRDLRYEEDMTRALLQQTERRLEGKVGASRESLLVVARGLAREAEWCREQRLRELEKENAK